MPLTELADAGDVDAVAILLAVKAAENQDSIAAERRRQPMACRAVVREPALRVEIQIHRLEVVALDQPCVVCVTGQGQSAPL